MRYIFLIQLILFPAASFAAILSENSREDAREIRAAFLEIAAGARGVGMGEAYTAVVDDASAIWWNPAGLSRAGCLTGVAIHNSMGIEGVSLSQAAIGIPVKKSVVGASITGLMFGSYEKRDQSGYVIGEGSITELSGSVAWAIPNVSFSKYPGWSGLAVEFVDETGGSMAIGVNIGSVYPISPRTMLGISLLHLGINDGEYSLPSILKMGTSYERNGFIWALDVGYPLIDKRAILASGFEWALLDSMRLRAGYRWQAGQAMPSGLTGLAAGFGFAVKSVGLDYAFQPYGDLAVSHRIALTFNRYPAHIP